MKSQPPRTAPMPSPSPSLPHSDGIGSSLFFSGSHSSILSGVPRGWSHGASPQLDVLSGGAPPHSVDATEVPRPEMHNGTRHVRGGSGSSDRGTGTSSAMASSAPSSGQRPRSGPSVESDAPTRNGVPHALQDFSFRYPTAQSSLEYGARVVPPPPPRQGSAQHEEESREWEDVRGDGADDREGHDSAEDGAVWAAGNAGSGLEADRVLRSLESFQADLSRRRSRPGAAEAQRTHTVSSSAATPTAAAAAAAAAARVAAAITRLSSDEDSHSASLSSSSVSARVQEGATPPAAASTTGTARTSTSAASAKASAGPAQQPASAARPSLDDPLAALDAAQVEAALQVYIDRGGVRASEVAAVLQTLPWCATGAAHATVCENAQAHHGSAESEEEGDEEEDGAVMLDPETWLSAVATAVASAKLEAPADAPAVPAAATSPTAKPRTAGTVLPASESPLAKTVSQSDPSPPTAVERTAQKRRSTGESESSVVLAAMAVTEEKRRRQPNTHAAAGAADGPTPSAGVPPHQHPQQGTHAAASQSASTDRRLEYDEDEDEAEWASAAVEAGFAVPPKPLLSASTSSVLSSSGRPPPARGLKDVAHRAAPTPQASTAEAGATAAQPSVPGDALPPRSPPAGAAPRRGSGGARQPSAGTATTTSSAEAGAAVPASSPPASLAPLAVPSAAALAGMRLLFQRCMHTPLASASALLTDWDWYALVEQLREEGRHKLPPQPILDDVARTIALTMEAEQRPTGLSLNEFVRLLHRQLEEVRVDMTSPPSPADAGDAAHAAAAATPSAGQLHFPSQPQYVLSLFGAPTHHGGPRRSRVATAGTGTGQWRVLPTWCMALAGLFSVEMATVCPVPIVRYLRSVGLMHAVLDAILQRLQIEVEALPELVPPPNAEKKKMPKKRGSARPGTKGGTASSSASAAVARDPDSSADEDSFVWPPLQEGSVLRSRPASGRGPSPGAAARPPSSVVLMGSVVLDEAAPAGAGPGRPAGAVNDLAWQEQPSWNGGKPTGRPPTTSAKSQGDGAAARAASAGEAGAAAATETTTQRHHHRHLLESRPLDEISASVVARAKARRLMDTLRRHTVPINRYECFARVEQEDEPVQKALCFVSKKELNATFGDGGGGGGGDGERDGVDGDGVDDDSDAMSDMIAALTYDPADELATSQGAKAGDGKREAASKPMDQTRTSVRPPQLPRMSASNVLPTVITGASRATRNGRARRSSASASGAGSMGHSNGTAPISGGADASQAGSPTGASLPPPRVTGMFRMTGVLSTALPRKQEEALVQRLSKPCCDPAAMGLRASPAGAATSPGGGVPFRGTPNSTPWGGTAAATHLAATTTKAATPMAIEDRPAPRPASGPVHHRRHMLLSTSHDTCGGSTGAARQHRSQPSPVWTDGFCASVCASGRDLRAFRPQRTSAAKASMTPTSPGPLDTTAATDSTAISADTDAAAPPAAARTSVGGAAAAAALTVEQNRGFFFFNVPSVLVAAPLSSSAAASAAAQVMCRGNSATGQQHPHAHHPPRPTLSGNANIGAALAGQSRTTPYRHDGLLSRMSKRGTGVRASSALPARTKPRHSSRSPTPQHPNPRPRATPDGCAEMGRAAADARQQLQQQQQTPRSPVPPSHHHISLYERRLQRKLQLAYANEHAYHHFSE